MRTCVNHSRHRRSRSGPRMPLAACSTMWAASLAVMRGPRAGSPAEGAWDDRAPCAGIGAPGPLLRARWDRAAGVNPSRRSSSGWDCDGAAPGALGADESCASRAAELGLRVDDCARNSAPPAREARWEAHSCCTPHVPRASRAQRLRRGVYSIGQKGVHCRTANCSIRKDALGLGHMCRLTALYRPTLKITHACIAFSARIGRDQAHLRFHGLL